MKCVPATNRMRGPKLGAANAPVKKRPGTLDSRWRSSTGAPAEKFEISAQGERNVVKAVQVEAKAGTGDDVICALGDTALGVPQVELDAIADCFGAEELVPEQRRYRSFDPVP